MTAFRQYNKLLVFVVTLSGIYVPSIELFLANRCLTKFLDIWSFVPIGCFTTFFFSSCKHLFFSNDHWLLKTYDINIIVSFSVLMFKWVYYKLKRRKFEKIFDLWDHSFQENLFPEQRQEILTMKKKKTDIYIIVTILLGLSAVVIWAIPPFFNPAKKLSHPTGMDYKSESPDYEILASYELVTALYAGVVGIAFDSVLMSLLSMEECQLVHLKRSLAEIVSTVKVTEDGGLLIRQNNEINELKLLKEHGLNVVIENQIFEHADEITMKNIRHMEKKLRVWVMHHQQLIRIHDELRSLSYWPLCMQFTSIVIAVCITCFLIAANALTVIDTITSVIYYVGNYAMFYINCKFGDTINQTSGGIFEDTFDKGWYTYPKTLKTIFHIILMRSQRPLDIVAFSIYPLGARSFYKIFKTAYSFFTFLLQMVRKRFRHSNKNKRN